MGYHSETKTPAEIREIFREVQATKVARAESSHEACRFDRELHITISGGIRRNHRGREEAAIAVASQLWQALLETARKHLAEAAQRGRTGEYALLANRMLERLRPLLAVGR